MNEWMSDERWIDGSMTHDGLMDWSLILINNQLSNIYQILF